jgi:prepilin-type processing-associated H-X9-DG protein
MGYILEAVIGPERVLTEAVRDQPAAVLVKLGQGIAMVPMTDELFAAVTDATSDRPLGFWKLPGGFERVLSDWSSAGPVGYVEAEFFAGDGRQRAALWADGHVAVGPLTVDEGRRFAEAGSPISQLLRHLGVQRDADHDEFDSVGLGRHRHTAEWAS